MVSVGDVGEVRAKVTRVAADRSSVTFRITGHGVPMTLHRTVLRLAVDRGPAAAQLEAGDEVTLRAEVASVRDDHVTLLIGGATYPILLRADFFIPGG